jgi:hypothetical protein
MYLEREKVHAVFHSMIRLLKNPIWILPIVCIIIVSCNFSQQPAPPAQGIVCGTIPNPLPQNAFSVQPIGTCFWKAFQQCHAASLTYVDQDEKTHIFSIKKNTAQCEVSDTVQQAKGSQKTFSYTCSQLQAFRGGNGALIFNNCGNDKTFTVAINPAIQ